MLRICSASRATSLPDATVVVEDLFPSVLASFNFVCVVNDAVHVTFEASWNFVEDGNDEATLQNVDNAVKLIFKNVGKHVLVTV